MDGVKAAEDAGIELARCREEHVVQPEEPKSCQDLLRAIRGWPAMEPDGADHLHA